MYSATICFNFFQMQYLVAIPNYHFDLKRIAHLLNFSWWHHWDKRKLSIAKWQTSRPAQPWFATQYWLPKLMKLILWWNSKTFAHSNQPSSQKLDRNSLFLPPLLSPISMHDWMICERSLPTCRAESIREWYWQSVAKYALVLLYVNCHHKLCNLVAKR